VINVTLTNRFTVNKKN